MGKSLEFKVRLKAAAIYVIVAIGVIATLLYVHSLQSGVSLQRAEITSRRTVLYAANDLIFRVSKAQSLANLYLSSKESSYLVQYGQSLDSIGMLIDTIMLLKPDGVKELRRVDSLLREQARNIVHLSRQFSVQNPMALMDERIRVDTLTILPDTQHIINIHQDTVYGVSPRKGFFKRLKEVFKPDRNPVQVAVDLRTDTIRTQVSDSLELRRRVDNLAQTARGIYDRNIRTIERRVSRLIATEKDLAVEISALLLEFHEDTLDSTLAMIGEGERRIYRNYIYSTIGGVVALALILIFILLIITDINRGARARRALEQANERIQQIMESRHRLLLSVSHDIKTPLNSIQGYLGQMRPEPDVLSMRNSAEHILAMLENLLEFSSLEKGTLQTSESDFGLRELCREIHGMFQPLAQGKGLGLSFEADDVRISTDRVKLKQIVVNLVSNGVKYTMHGSVRFEARFDGTTLWVEVRDTGVGIPTQRQSLLFRPFSRVEENNALAGGNGFGLFVVKGLVELLGGRIALDSQVGVGTTVLCELPVAPARREIPQGRKRIRVYDDDPVIVRMLSGMLSGLGHRVVEGDCDLILTDLEMGETSGFDVLREANTTPVVVMTGRADFTASQAVAAGFAGFIAKPFSAEALREIVGVGEVVDDLLGGDREAILTLFRSATAENFELLRQALADDDFSKAQALCHKMFPMFAQLGYPTEELRRVDMHRAGPYEGWREDVTAILAIRV